MTKAQAKVLIEHMCQSAKHQGAMKVERKSSLGMGLIAY